MASLRQQLCARHAATTGPAVGTNSSGDAVAVGGSKGLCVFDLEWPWEPHCWLPHDDAVLALLWHPSTRHSLIMAAVGESGNLSLYDVSGARLANSLAARRRLPFVAKNLAWSIAMGHTLAVRSADGTVALWDSRTDRLSGIGCADVHSQKDSDSVPASLGALTWGSEATGEHLIASSYGGCVRVWDVRQPRMPSVDFVAHEENIHCLAWRCASSRDATELLSVGSDGWLRLWEWDYAHSNLPSSAALHEVGCAGCGIGGSTLDEASATVEPLPHPLVRCLTSSRSQMPIRSACGVPPPLSGSDGRASDVAALTVCELVEECATRSSSPDITSLTYGLQLWRLTPPGVGVTASLVANECISAGQVRSVACAAGPSLVDNINLTEHLLGDFHFSSVGDDQCAQDACTSVPLLSLCSSHLDSAPRCLRLTTVVPYGDTPRQCPGTFIIDADGR